MSNEIDNVECKRARGRVDASLARLIPSIAEFTATYTLPILWFPDFKFASVAYDRIALQPREALPWLRGSSRSHANRYQ